MPLYETIPIARNYNSSVTPVDPVCPVCSREARGEFVPLSALDSELAGLVYGCTEIPSESSVPLLQKPAFWAVVCAVVFVILQIIFW